MESGLFAYVRQLMEIFSKLKVLPQSIFALITEPKLKKF